MVLLKIDRIAAREVARRLDPKVSTIYHWSFRLNKMGIEGLLGKKRGGRRNQHMTIGEEVALLQKLRADGEKGFDTHCANSKAAR